MINKETSLEMTIAEQSNFINSYLEIAPFQWGPVILTLFITAIFSLFSLSLFSLRQSLLAVSIFMGLTGLVTWACYKKVPARMKAETYMALALEGKPVRLEERGRGHFLLPGDRYKASRRLVNKREIEQLNMTALRTGIQPANIYIQD